MPWDEIDAEAEREGEAIKDSFRRETPKRGVGKTNRSAYSRDYRVTRGDLLKKHNVIDGKATK